MKPEKEMTEEFMIGFCIGGLAVGSLFFAIFVAPIL